jgi:hypothetical protein
MKSGIESVKDVIEISAWIVGAGALAFAAITYRLNRSQFNFAVMTSCVDRYQKIITQLKYGKDQDKVIALGQYIDLCNEELFYFEKKYLPGAVIDEWLEGMVNYLPYFNEKGDNLNPGCLPEIIGQNLLSDYPRIKRTFTVPRDYDLSKEVEGKELIAQIKKNLYRKSK